ncbi:FAD-dependent monooxygenase [Streptomyces sp. NPDC000410]|uniref:FAD-dependent monooxygenase n=1 Tax=Streptomyces sp. NPDC000410 TaxID=3154254 RepID=UPI003333B872
MGAGPAGLYFAISAKLRDAGHQITVLERDPPLATYGWGVVYWEDLLDVLYRNDPESAREVSARSVLWQDQEIRVHGPRGEQTAYFGGYGYSLGRAALLELLARRARQLGVEIAYDRSVDDPARLPDADLVVAADGASSRIRQQRQNAFGTRVDPGRNYYIWLGTDRMFDSFVFSFEHTPAGWIWFHAYPSMPGISTCIVECPQETWHALDLGTREHDEGLRLLEKIFHSALDGHRLISSARGAPANWQRFAHVSNRTWYDGSTVLVGDAAHTTHFTLGSGTRLAVIDAITLADSLSATPDLGAALDAYDRRRRAALHPLQGAARSSMAWFEQADHYLDRDAVAFAHAMSVRHAPQAPWQYRLHLATQYTAVRRIRRAYSSGSRWYRAGRRGEEMTTVRARMLASGGGQADPAVPIDRKGPTGPAGPAEPPGPPEPTDSTGPAAGPTVNPP